MADWIEEMREQRRREDEAAIFKDYARCVDDEDFEDTDDARRAFVAGWYATRRFAAAKQDLNAAGHGSYMGAILLWLLPGSFLFCFAILWSQGVEMNPNAGWYAAGCFVLIGLGFLSMKRSRRLADEAYRNHREKWGR